jgi:hypothetical protein
MHNTSDEYGPGVIDAINHYYGRSDIPIGVYKRDGALSARLINKKRLYAESIARNSRFPKRIATRREAPSALELYKRILSEQPDGSLIIISVGWTTNLKQLHQDAEGAELIMRKVKRLVLMGGYWDPPDMKRRAWMNLAGNQVVPAAFWAGKYIINNWPTELIFCGAKIGEQIQTGECLKSTPENNPVREAYRIFKRNTQTWDHNSYDQCTSLFAVRGKSDHWLLHKEGGARILSFAQISCVFLN